LPALHPARTRHTMRYIQMGDAPGAGAIPLTVPCKQTSDHRAPVNQQDAVRCTDPLEPNPHASDVARLTRIGRNLTFRTCLALSSEVNLGNIKRKIFARYCTMSTGTSVIT
jgi:hypothetical protein